MLPLIERADYITNEKRYITLLWSGFTSILGLKYLISQYKLLNLFDFFYLLIGLFISVGLFLLMLIPNCNILHIIHIILPTILFFSPLLINYYAILISLITIFVMHITWYFYGKCIIFKEDETWNMDLPQNLSAYIWTCILSYKLYTKHLHN